MRIALVTGRYYPFIGGVETHVQEIANHLVKRGANLEVEVLTTDPSGKLPKNDFVNGVEVRRFKSWAPNEAYFFSRSLRKYLMENSESFDIVHAHGYHSFVPLYAAQAKSRNKLIFTPHYHGGGHTFFRSLLHKPYRLLGKKIFKEADKVICVSKCEKDLVLKHFGVDEKKIEMIPNGINLEEFQDLKKTRNKRGRTILSVGRLEKYKGVHYLIEALAKVNDNMILEVVGKGAYKESLIKLASSLGIAGRVRFFEDLPRSELLQKYADADLFALLSKHEAYGICVAEALASGTPCIVSNTSALTEWIDDQNCFGINNPANVAELVSLLDKVIGRSVEKPKLLDWDEVTDKLIKVYECL